MEAAYSEHSIAIHSSLMAGYVNAAPAFVCSNSQTKRQAVSVIFVTFISSLIEVNFCFFRYAY